MYIEREYIQEYPFSGRFYTTGVDESKPLEEQVEEEIEILTTVCDIQENSHSNGRFLSSDYVVYIPFKKRNDDIKIKLGYMFSSNMYGLEINGKVTGVFPSQLGGIAIYIQDLDV
jgi:hypothetical protein